MQPCSDRLLELWNQNSNEISKRVKVKLPNRVDAALFAPVVTTLTEKEGYGKENLNDGNRVHFPSWWESDFGPQVITSEIDFETEHRISISPFGTTQLLYIMDDYEEDEGVYTVPDHSGNGRTANESGGSFISSKSPVFGQALKILPGGSFSSSANFSIMPHFTMSFLFKLDDAPLSYTGYGHSCFSKVDGLKGVEILLLPVSEDHVKIRLKFNTAGGGGETYIWTSSTVLDTTSWHWISWDLNGANFSLWIDGEKESGTSAVTPDDPEYGQWNFNSGASGATFTIDDVCFSTGGTVSDLDIRRIQTFYQTEATAEGDIRLADYEYEFGTILETRLRSSGVWSSKLVDFGSVPGTAGRINISDTGANFSQSATVKEQDTITGGLDKLNNTTRLYFAQSFEHSSNFAMNKIKIFMGQSLVPSWYQVWVELWSDNAGAPGSALAASTAIYTQYLPNGTQDWVEFTFSTVFEILADTKYHIVICSNYIPSLPYQGIDVGYDAGATYTDGTAHRYDTVEGWVELPTRDWSFKVYEVAYITRITYYYRSSDDSWTWSAWTQAEAGATQISISAHQYWQIAAYLESTNFLETPYIHEIEFEYSSDEIVVEWTLAQELSCLDIYGHPGSGWIKTFSTFYWDEDTAAWVSWDVVSAVGKNKNRNPEPDVDIDGNEVTGNCAFYGLILDTIRTRKIKILLTEAYADAVFKLCEVEAYPERTITKDSHIRVWNSLDPAKKEFSLTENNLTLSNKDRRFAISYAPSAAEVADGFFNQELRPGLEISIELGFQDEILKVFTGLIDRIDAEPLTDIATFKTRDFGKKMKIRTITIDNDEVAEKSAENCIEYLANLCNIPSTHMNLAATNYILDFFQPSEANAWDESQMIAQSLGNAGLYFDEIGDLILRYLTNERRWVQTSLSHFQNGEGKRAYCDLVAGDVLGRIIYNANSKFPDEEGFPWEVTATGYENIPPGVWRARRSIYTGGYLHTIWHTYNQPGALGYHRDGVCFPNATGNFAQIRVRLQEPFHVPPYHPTNYFVFLEVADGTKYASAAIALDRVWASGSDGYKEYLMNTWESAHEYVLELKGNSYKIWVDGTLRISGTPVASGSNFVEFGHNANGFGGIVVCEDFVDYVTYSRGAYDLSDVKTGSWKSDILDTTLDAPIYQNFIGGILKPDGCSITVKTATSDDGVNWDAEVEIGDKIEDGYNISGSIQSASKRYFYYVIYYTNNDQDLEFRLFSSIVSYLVTGETAIPTEALYIISDGVHLNNFKQSISDEDGGQEILINRATVKASPLFIQASERVWNGGSLTMDAGTTQMITAAPEDPCAKTVTMVLTVRSGGDSNIYYGDGTKSEGIANLTGTFTPHSRKPTLELTAAASVVIDSMDMDAQPYRVIGKIEETVESADFARESKENGIRDPVNPDNPYITTAEMARIIAQILVTRNHRPKMYLSNLECRLTPFAQRCDKIRVVHERLGINADFFIVSTDWEVSVSGEEISASSVFEVVDTL